MRPLVATSQTYINHLCIEADPSGRTRCKACKSPIEKFTPRVSFYRSMVKSYFFHLHCFTPITHVRIDPIRRGFTIRGDIETEAQTWIAAWNRQFDFDASMIAAYASKRIATNQPTSRRCLLESFKFLDAVTIVRSVATVAKGWYHVAWEEELWRQMCVSPGSEVEFLGEYRKSYLCFWMRKCAHCEKTLEREERYMVCPLTLRPKCAACYWVKKFRPHRMAWAEEDYQMSESLVKKLGVPIFVFDGFKCVYPYQALAKAGKYRKALAEKLIADNKEDLRAIASLKWINLLKNAHENHFHSLTQLRDLFEKQPLTEAMDSFLRFILAGKPASSFSRFLASLPS